jgi:NAD(P)H-dependent flavin oxidoreductase YrpB (nitropropane dioxygenase family)
MKDLETRMQWLAAPILSLPIVSKPSVNVLMAQIERGIIGSINLSIGDERKEAEKYFEQLSKEISQISPRNSYSRPAPYVVRVHCSVDRKTFEEHIDICAVFKVPIVILTGMASGKMSAKIRRYGGLVLQEVYGLSQIAFAEKQGVDGLVLHWNELLKCAPAIDVFSLLTDIKRSFRGLIVVAGAAHLGMHILGLQAMGVDLVCIRNRLATANDIQTQSLNKNMLLYQSDDRSLEDDSLNPVEAGHDGMSQSQGLRQIICEVIDEYDSASYSIKRKQRLRTPEPLKFA